MTAGPGTGSQKVSRDGAVYLASALVQRGLPFLALLLLARLLDPRDVGQVGVALSVANLLALALPFGLNFGILRLFFDEPASAARTRWSMLLRLQVVLTSAVTALAVLTGSWWSQGFRDLPWPGALLPAVLYGACLAVQATALSVLRAARKPTVFASVAVAQAIIGTATGLALAPRFGAAGYLYGLTGGALAGAVWATLTVRRPARWDRSAVLPAALLSLPFVGHALGGWVVSLSDRILIERYLGLEQAGRYLVLYTLGMASFLVLDAVQTAWTPVYFGYTSEVKHGYASRVVMHATTLGASLAGIVACLSPAVLLLVTPDEYSDDLTVLALIAISAAVRPAYLVAVTQCLDNKDSRRPALSTCVAALTSITVNVALLPRIGLVAAGLAGALAFSAQALLVHRAARRYARQPSTWRLVTVWLIWAAVYLTVTTLPSSQWWGWVLRLVAVVAMATAAISAARSLRGSVPLPTGPDSRAHPALDF